MLCNAVSACVIVATVAVANIHHFSHVYLAVSGGLVLCICVSLVCHLTESCVRVGLYTLVGWLQVWPALGLLELCAADTDLRLLQLHFACLGLYILHLTGTRAAVTLIFLVTQLLVLNVGVVLKQTSCVSPGNGAAPWWIAICHQVLLANACYTLVTLNADLVAKDLLTEAEAQAEEMHQRLVQQTEDQVHMREIFAHEFRTPLNIINGQCGLLAAHPSMDVAEQAGSVLRSSKEIQEKINAVLDYTEVVCALEPLPLMVTEFDLRDHISVVVEQFAPQAADQQVRLLLDAEASLPPYVAGDERRLKKILDPVIHNAVKFSLSGQAVHIRMSLAETDAGPLLQYTITDEGRGMDQAQQARALQPFSTGARHGGGLGLGLTIAEHLARSQGGHLSIHSPGRGLGSEVTLAIPVDPRRKPRPPSQFAHCFKLHESCTPMVRQQFLWLGCKIWEEGAGDEFDVLVLDSDFVEVVEVVAAAKCPVIEIASAARSASGVGAVAVPEAEEHVTVVKPLLPNKLREAIHSCGAPSIHEASETSNTIRRVLVVDDVRLNRMLLIRNLAKELTIEFDEAENGSEALHLAMTNATAYDIILLDCNMPIMDGYETAQRLRQIPRYTNVPIFAVTANDCISDHAKCYSSGVDRVISKPVDFPALLKEMRKAFDVLNGRLSPTLVQPPDSLIHSIDKPPNTLGTSANDDSQVSMSATGDSQIAVLSTPRRSSPRPSASVHASAHAGLHRNFSTISSPSLGRNMSGISLCNTRSRGPRKLPSIASFTRYTPRPA